MENIKDYSPTEEKINVISHAVGFVLSFVALILLVTRATKYGNIWHVVSFSIFGATLIILYGASTFYHRAKNPKLRKKLKILDHAAIYLLIAGTYTPYVLVTLHGTTGWVVFSIIWTLALIGIIFKLFFTGKFNLISTITYVAMGWVIFSVIKPLVNNLPLEGVVWLFAGGFAYTIGAVLYSIEKIKFNHAIFHVFVLIGSVCQFLSILIYVLPKK